MPLLPPPGQVFVVSDSACVHLGVAYLCVCVYVSVFGQRWGPRLGEALLGFRAH